MIPTSVLLHECTAEEARSFPRGFQFLEYDGLYGSLRIMTAGVNHVRSERRFVYLCYKLPPATWQSPIAGKRSALKASRVTDKDFRRALDNV